MELSVDTLFEMRDKFESGWAKDYLSGPESEATHFDFLIGDWIMTRRTFDTSGNVIEQSNGEMSARYTFDKRIIQEDFWSYLANGDTFRGGTALYTYSPGSKQWFVVALDACKGGSSFTPSFDNCEIQYDTVVEIQGSVVHTKNRWYDISHKSYVWEQSGSIDGTKWYIAFDAKFVKKGAHNN